jgi:hypothetical protein
LQLNFLLCKKTFMQNEIKLWLDGSRDYTEGFRLLEKYVNNRVMLRSLGRRRDEVARQKLAYELVKLAGLPEKKAYEKPVAVNGKQPVENREWKGAGKEANSLEVIERGKLINERGVLWKEIHKIGPENTTDKITDRLNILTEIKALSKKIEMLSFKIKGLPSKLQNKATPPPVEKELTLAGLLSLRKYYENKISRRAQLRSILNGNLLRGIAPLPEGKKREKKMLQLDAVESEIAQIKKQLAKYEEETTGK